MEDPVYAKARMKEIVFGDPKFFPPGVTKDGLQIKLHQMDPAEFALPEPVTTAVDSRDAPKISPKTGFFNRVCSRLLRGKA